MYSISMMLVRLVPLAPSCFAALASSRLPCCSRSTFLRKVVGPSSQQPRPRGIVFKCPGVSSESPFVPTFPWAWTFVLLHFSHARGCPSTLTSKLCEEVVQDNGHPLVVSVNLRRVFVDVINLRGGTGPGNRRKRDEEDVLRVPCVMA